MSDVKWIKLMTDMFDNRKIKQIESLPSGDSIIVIWMKLLCLAGNTNEQGLIYFTKSIPYTDEMLATEIGKPLSTIKLALATFSEFEMIEVINGVICICNWEKYQNVDGMQKVKEQTRLRVQKYRARKKLLIENHENDVTLPVTLRNAIEEDKELDKDINKESEKEKINYHEIIDLYNDTCVSFPRVQKLSEARKKAIRARLKSYTLDDFRNMFAKAEASNFLKGQNQRNWSANFDWMIKDSNMAKILDGNYDNHKSQNFGSSKYSFQQNSYDFDALEKDLIKN